MAEEQIYQEDQAAPPPPGDETPLPEEHRKKLDTIVGQMILNKESEDNIKAVVNDFKTKYKSPIAADVDNSKNFIQGYLQSPQANKAIDKITMGDYLQDFYKNQGGMKQDATRNVQSLPIRLPDKTKEDRANFMQTANENPDLLRPVLERAKRDNPKDAAAINKAMYLADASNRPHSPTIVKHNADRIASGELEYDVNKKQLQKPQGFFDSVFQGAKHHSDAMDVYDFVTSHHDNDPEIIKYLDEKIKDIDPDNPVPGSKGNMASIGEMLGSSAVPVGKMEVPAAIASRFGGAIGAAGTIVGNILMAGDFHHTAYANTLLNVYAEERRKGTPAQDALEKANDKAKYSANLAAGQSIALGASAGKIGKNAEFKPVQYTTKDLRVFKDVSKNAGALIKQIAPEIGKQDAVAAGIKAIENKNQGKPVTEGAWDTVMGQTLFMATLGALRGRGVFFTKEGRTNALDAVSKAPPEEIDKSLGDLVDGGHISMKDAVDIKSEVESYKVIKENKLDFSSPITDEATQLLNHVDESENPVQINPKILKKIASDNGIEPEKTAEGKEKELTQGEVIDALKKRQETVKAAPTFENRTKIDPEKLKGTYKVMYEKDPEGFEQFIAEQVHSGNRTELEQADGITKPIIDAAIKKYPEHQVSEPKESSVSVIRPEENTAPNIVNLKNQENAIPIRSPEAANVAETSSNSGEMGEGIPESGKTPVSQGSESPVQNTGEVPPVSEPPAQPTGDELPFGNAKDIGIAHDVQVERAYDLKVMQPERGEGITLEQSIQRGKDLIESGVKPEDIVADFQKTNRLSADDMAVVRARQNELTRATDQASDKFGDNSEEYKTARKAERDWFNTAVKPMQTEWHGIGIAQQGRTDIETGTVSGIRRAFHDENNVDPTPEQSKTAKELSDKVKEQNDKIAGLQKKLDDIHATGDAKGTKNIAQSGKDFAQKLRDNAKLSRPGMFSAATPASLVWDGAVEIVAKGIEAGAEIAQAIANGVKHIKDSEWYKGLGEEKQKEAEKEFRAWHNEQSTHISFADKKGNAFTPDEVKVVWNHAKTNYIDKGIDFADMVNNTAMDLGLSSEQVIHAISKPKGAKTITDAMYKAMYERRLATQRAQLWVKTANNSKAYKFFKSIPNAFFAVTTFGHGTVGAITHAGMDLYRPSNWSKYFPFVIKQFEFAFGNTGKYEQAMQALIKDPQFDFWKRAGLAVDPRKLTTDDYQGWTKVFGKLGATGERGFNALKVYRLSQAKDIWSHLSDEQRADPEVPKTIANGVNLSTGSSNIGLSGKANDVASTILFAPKLEGSKWQRIFNEPVKAVHTAGKLALGKEVSEAEKVQAKMVARHAGEMMATMAAFLASNQAVLTLTGSKQNINFTNPLESDWLKFKVGDMQLDASGGMISTTRFISTLIEEGFKANFSKPAKGEKEPSDIEGDKILSQLRYKLSPFAGTVAELATGKDFNKNPLPWSKKEGTAKHPKISVGDYIASHMPIPFAEYYRTMEEGAKSRGVSQPQFDDYVKGVIAGIVSGGTGAKLSPDYSLEGKTKTKSKATVNHNFTN